MNKINKSIVGFCLLAISASASSAVLLASNQAGLATALHAAQGGDTIVLNGTFGLTYVKHYSWSSLVTIDATKANFTDALAISDLKNLKVIGGHFGSATTSLAYGEGIYVNGVNNVSFINPTVVGNYLTAGIGILGSTNIAVTGGNFSNVHKAIGIGGVTNGTISGNTVIGSTGDGFQVADSHNVAVTANSCSGGTPLQGDHPDCVQLWSIAGHAPESDIVVSNNYASGYTQGFTEFDHAQGGLLRASITGNTVASYLPQGIACYDCVDSLVANNKLITLPGAPHVVNLNVIGGQNTTVADNTLTGYDRSKAQAIPFWTLNQLTNGQNPGSNTVAAVPEATMWSTLVAGFGLIGSASRRRRTAAAVTA